MLLAVYVVEVVYAVLKSAFARLAVPSPLLRGRGSRGDHLGLAKLGGKVHLLLSRLFAVGIKFGFLRQKVGTMESGGSKRESGPYGMHIPLNTKTRKKPQLLLLVTGVIRAPEFPADTARLKNAA